MNMVHSCVHLRLDCYSAEETVFHLNLNLNLSVDMGGYCRRKASSIWRRSVSRSSASQHLIVMVVQAIYQEMQPRPILV